MDEIRKSIIAILARETSAHDYAGTGFLIAGGIVVTCAHVIKAAREEDNSVRLRCENGAEVRAQIVAESAVDEHDLAILRAGGLPADIPPLRLADSDNCDGHAFGTFGYPELSVALSMLAAEGRILASIKSEKGHAILQLHSEQVTKGYSGSPVWDVELQAVVGVINSGIVVKAGDAHHGTSFATPAETLKILHPALNVPKIEPNSAQLSTSALPTLPPRGELPEPGILPPGARLYSGRNPNFTGRAADLLALAEALVYDPQPGALTVAQVLAGLGGLGKSQLAVEFCYRYGRYFKGVHWLDARQALEVEISECGEKMDLPNWPPTTPEQKKLTLDAWQAEPRRLLVLDNLEEPEVLRTWKPELEGMSLLVTSRNLTWDTDLAAVRRLDVLPRAESLALLRHLAPRLETTPEAELGPLAARLGDLPLALDLAGRYLKDHPLPPSQYLEKLRETALRHRSLKATGAGSPTSHATDVEGTILVSWEQLQDDECDALAKCFFIAAGYLASNLPIPRDIFYALAFPQAEWKETDQPDIWKYSEPADDALLRLQALGLLTETLAQHPLLAEFARAQETDSAVLTALADKMATLSRQAYKTGLPASFTPLRPHLETLAPIAERAGLAKARTLWNSLGLHQKRAAEYAAARAAYERALAIAEATLGKEHPTVMTYINNLGSVLQTMGDLPGAKNYFERALAIDEKNYDKDPTNVARDAKNLGSVLRALGDLPGAKAHLERALAIDEKTYGKEHPNVARDVNDLGLVLDNMGDLPSAKNYYERALAIDEKTFGSEHPKIAIHVNNLGSVLYDLGDLPGAKSHFEHALAIWENQYGLEHPQVATGANNLGKVLQKMGDLSGAKSCYERALAIYEKKLGKEHPYIANSLDNLAVLLTEMGDLPGALALDQRALVMFEKFLPPEHPEIQTTRQNLADIEHKMGKSEK